MQITAYSFIMALLWLILFAGLISCLRKNVDFIKYLYVYSFLFLIAVTLVRLSLPIDVRHSHIITSEKWLPAVIRTMTSPLMRIGTISITPLFCLITIWVVGIVVNIALLLGTQIKTSRRNAALESRMAPVIEKLIASMPNFPTRLKVVQHEAVASPVLVGLRNPVLFLPVAELEDEEWRLVVQHELAHLRMKDISIRALIVCFRVIFWWHIGIRSLAKDLDYILEIRCDSAVLKHASKGTVKRYSYALLKLAEALSDAGAGVSGVASTFKRKNRSKNEMLLQRFELIQHHRKPKKSNAMTLGLLAVGISLFILSYSVILQPVFYPEIDSKTQFQITEGETTLIELPGGGFELYVGDVFIGIVEDINNIQFGDLMKREDGIIP